jgi:hypothetical protein
MGKFVLAYQALHKAAAASTAAGTLTGTGSTIDYVLRFWSIALTLRLVMLQSWIN